MKFWQQTHLSSRHSTILRAKVRRRTVWSAESRKSAEGSGGEQVASPKIVLVSSCDVVANPYKVTTWISIDYKIFGLKYEEQIVKDQLWTLRLQKQTWGRRFVLGELFESEESSRLVSSQIWALEEKFAVYSLILTLLIIYRLCQSISSKPIDLQDARGLRRYCPLFQTEIYRKKHLKPLEICKNMYLPDCIQDVLKLFLKRRSRGDRRWKQLKILAMSLK